MNDILKKIIDTSKIYKDKRAHELQPEIFKEKMKEKNNLKREEEINTGKTIISETSPLTDLQITEFGETIAKEFETDYADYNPYAKRVGYMKICKTETLRENQGMECQEIYFLCINKIKELGLDIFSITKTLKNFRERVTGVMRDTTVFKFIGKKNNYECSLLYLNDNDYDKNPLLINITYLPNNLKLTSYGEDLFDTNGETINIMYLLNSTNPSTYMEIRFGHLIRIPKLLEEKYSLVIAPIDKTDSYFSKIMVSLRDTTLTGFFVTVNNIEMLIYAMYQGNYYGLRIMPKPSDWDADGKSIFMKYESDEDISCLYDNIVANQNHNAGLYGYYDHNTKCYYNDRNIIDFLTELTSKEFPERTASSSFVDCTHTKFDLTYCYRPDGNKTHLLHDRSQYNNYFDTYEITFIYDNHNNNDSRLQIKAKTDTVDVYELEATFMECYETLMIFFKQII